MGYYCPLDGILEPLQGTPQQFVAAISFMHPGEERHSEENSLTHVAFKDFSDVLSTDFKRGK